ncbi:MAG: hypothetical protein IIB56_09710 [Planctomycetes bacterium]|nr:hypothetical protein [Planctomycetota bacterium]
MASGDVLMQDFEGFRVLFLDAADAASDGVWFATKDYRSKSFSIDPAVAMESGGTAEVHVLNADSPPANSVAGSSIALTLTPTVKSGVVNDHWDYMKVKRAVGGSPTLIKVIGSGRR